MADRLKASGALDQIFEQIDAGEVPLGGDDGLLKGMLKAANVEVDIVAALATLTDLPDRVVWAVDIVGAPSALILALLARAGSPVFYASGRVVNTMTAAYTGEVRPTRRMPT